MLKEYRCLAGSVEAGLPFCDQRLPMAERVEWIVANLSVPEMVAIVNKQPVGRLNIPGYAMWQIEALHGVRLWPEKCPFPDRCTTIFPTASTGSRAFNTSLWQQIGQAMGTEGRVLWNLGITSDLSLRGSLPDPIAHVSATPAPRTPPCEMPAGRVHPLRVGR